MRSALSRRTSPTRSAPAISGTTRAGSKLLQRLIWSTNDTAANSPLSQRDAANSATTASTQAICRMQAAMYSVMSRPSPLI